MAPNEPKRITILTSPFSTFDLFSRLFTQNPDLYDVFPFAEGHSSWETLHETVGMRGHALAVATTVDAAVTGLTDLNSLVPVLEGLGKRHAQYGIKPEYFAVRISCKTHKHRHIFPCTTQE